MISSPPTPHPASPTNLLALTRPRLAPAPSCPQHFPGKAVPLTMLFPGAHTSLLILGFHVERVASFQEAPRDCLLCVSWLLTTAAP